MKTHLIVCTVFFSIFSSAFSQRNVGLTIGPTAARFMGSSKNEEYTVKSRIKPGVFLGSYYEMKSDSTSYIRFGLLYQYQQADLTIDERMSHFGSNHGTFNYQFHQIRTSIGYAIKLTSKKRVDTRILFGAWGSYYFGTHVKGNTSILDFKSGVDSTGNEVSFTVHEYEEFDGYDKMATSKFSGGFYLGWSIAIPVNEKTSFLIQNEYFINFSPVARPKHFNGASMLNGTLGLGISYKI